MKCTKCGTDNVKGKSVCRKCGAFLYAANPNNRVPLTAEQRKARRRMLIKGTAGGCLWSALIIIGLFVALGIISYLLVRFVIPDDVLEGMIPQTTPQVSIESGSSDPSSTLPSISP